MNTDKLDDVDIFDINDVDVKNSSDDEEDIMSEIEEMNTNMDDIIQDTFIVDRKDIIISAFNDIPFLNSDASVLSFSEEQAHNEIFNLTENFNFKKIFKEISSIETNSIKNPHLIERFMASKWFYPIVRFKKERLDYDFETVQNFETEHYKQTSLLQFLKRIKDLKVKYSPVYDDTKISNMKLEQDTHALWDYSISDASKMENYLNPENGKSKSLIWDEESLKSYVDNVWSNYDNNSDDIEDKRIFEYKRMIKNENVDVSGMFINNDNSNRAFHLFDVDEYFSKLNGITTFPVDATLNETNSIKDVKITSKKNNVITILHKDNTEEFYDISNPTTHVLLYLKNSTYSYIYSKKDFYDSNMVFLSNEIDFLKVAPIFIPDVYDFFMLNKLDDFSSINTKLKHFHNSTIEDLHAHSFSLLKEKYKYKPEKKQFTSIPEKNYKSSFVSTYDILNKENYNKAGLVTNKKFDDKIPTKMDSNMRRFNTLESFQDKGLDVVYHLHVLKFLNAIMSLKPFADEGKESISFDMKDIYDVNKLKEIKKNYSINGKTKFKDFNDTIQNVDKIKKDISRSHKELLSFMKTKHIVPYSSIKSTGNTSKQIKDTTFDDVSLHYDISTYDAPTVFEQPQGKNTIDDEFAKVVLSLGLKVTDPQLRALLEYFETHVNKLESQQKDPSKPLPTKSKMIILFSWVLVFAQIIDKSLIKKNLIDDCINKYSIGGYPIDDIDQTNTSEIYKRNKDKSLIGYLACVFMYQNNIVNTLYEKIMMEIMKRVNDIFKMFPYLKNKLKDTHQLKNLKHQKFEITKTYVKMFKPFNQNLNNIELSKTTIDRSNKSKGRNFDISSSIKFKKPHQIIKTQTPAQIVHDKANVTFKDIKENSKTIDDFIRVNDWISDESKKAINDVENKYALSEHIETLFSSYEAINNNASFREYYDSSLDDTVEVSEVLKQNFNVYLSDVIHRQVNHMFKFSNTLQESPIFDVKFKNNMRLYIIKGLEILNKVKLEVKRKKQIFIVVLLSSLLNITKDYTNKDENGEIVVSQGVNTFNNFINAAFENNMKQIHRINKEDLKRKYNVLRSDERAKESQKVNNMTDEEIDLYFAYKKIGLESSEIQLEHNIGATEDQSVDQGDGDGDFQEFKEE